MRQFWALLALGAAGFLIGTIGMSADSQESRAASIEVLAPAPGVDVAPWVHL